MEPLQDWDIMDGWRDDRAVLGVHVASDLEAQVGWLVRHHCTNKDIAKLLSLIRGERVTTESVKKRINILCARLGVRGRGSVARRLARKVDEHRAAAGPPVLDA